MAKGTTDTLDSATIRAGLSYAARAWVKELQIHQTIDSTNSHLMRGIAGGVDGVVCLAESQTGGRGRRGRTWLMSPGRGIAMSLGRTMQMPVSQIAPLSLVVGVAVADALERVGVSDVKLKWPNDVLVDGAKAGGILVEVANAAEPVVVVGVGLNMGAGAAVAKQLGIDVGDVLNANRSVARNVVVAALIDSIVDFAAAFERAGFESIRGAWERLHAHQNLPVQVQGTDQPVHGIARGVTPSGELILETTTGTRHFNSGEVSLRAK